jgi:hypothetical protein
MRNEIPILHLSSHTPKFNDVGLYLNSSRFHGGPETKAVWLHGILVLEVKNFSAQDEQKWLEAINLVAVSEANQLPVIAPVIGERTLLQRHSEEVALDGGRVVRVLPFSFNLKDVFRDGLYEDNYYVHISVRHFCSVPVRIMLDENDLPGYLEEAEKPDPKYTEIDQLIKAYDAYDGGRYADAVGYFQQALENKTVQSDIDRPNYYNAGYCAGRFALETEAPVAKELLNKTTDWIEQDLKIRNALLEEIQTSLLSDNKASKIEQLEEKRLQLLKDIGLT